MPWRAASADAARDDPERRRRGVVLRKRLREGEQSQEPALVVLGEGRGRRRRRRPEVQPEQVDDRARTRRTLESCERGDQRAAVLGVPGIEGPRAARDGERRAGARDDR
jgi:hypothetical protein